jgi:hypothetical protein
MESYPNYPINDQIPSNQSLKNKVLAQMKARSDNYLSNRPSLSQYIQDADEKQRTNNAKQVALLESQKLLNKAASSKVAANAMKNIVEPGIDAAMLIEGGVLAKNAIKSGLKSMSKKAINPTTWSPMDEAAMEKFYRREFAPQTKHQDALDVLNNFKERIKTPEGQKRLKNLGINDESLQKLKIIEDNTTYGYYNNNKIGLHKDLPYTGTVARHEIEHGVQGSLNNKGWTKIDEILSNLELRKTPNKISRVSDNTEDIYLDRHEFNRKMSNKQAATDYFTYGSDGREKSAFAAEAQQYMLDKGIIKHPYEAITPEKVKHAMVEAQFDKETYPIRLFHIMKNTDNNYKTVANALNKMLTVSPIIAGGAATLGANKLNSMKKNEK